MRDKGEMNMLWENFEMECTDYLKKNLALMQYLRIWAVRIQQYRILKQKHLQEKLFLSKSNILLHNAVSLFCFLVFKKEILFTVTKM